MSLPKNPATSRNSCVDYGSRVKKGQLMAVLEIPEMQALLQEDKAAIKSASDQVANAATPAGPHRSPAQSPPSAIRPRLNSVAQTKPGLVAQQEVDDAQGKDLAAEAQVEGGKSSLEVAQSQLAVAESKMAHDQALYDYARITAPFAGVVTQRYANFGTLMQAGTSSSTAMPLVKLSEEDVFRLVIPVPESYVQYIKIGDPVDVRVPSLGHNFPGKVARFSVDVGEATRTMHTEVDVPNPKGELIPGVYAEATLTLDRRGDALTVPLQAVNQATDHADVLVVDSANKIEDRPITLGIQTSTDAEVLSGLHEGDQVVVGDRAELKPGEQVHPTVSSVGTYQAQNLMSRFAIRTPYFIVVICLVLCLLGVVSVARMPVDLFPTINMPEVVVATFYSGMPPGDIETDITNPLERFFTMAAGVDHSESRSMLGVSLIKVYFQPGTNADADVTELSNLALADLKRLPPGTLPPVVLKFDASSQPVCLVTVKGQGLSETQLHDLAQFTIRNQIAVVPGATIPPPFGGKYRQVMVYVDPYKLMSRQMSPMDVVNAVNRSNLILPAGDVKLGPFDYYVYSNSLVDNMKELNDVPIKVDGNSWVSVKDVGQAEDASAIQYNLVRVDGQRSTYIPIMKQGGNTNTIAVVNGVRKLLGNLYDLPKQLKTSVLFDQSVFVKDAIDTVLHEGLIGLALTSIMILLFLGSPRATSAVLFRFRFPLSRRSSSSA